jgi:hypothetical protein
MLHEVYDCYDGSGLGQPNLEQFRSFAKGNTAFARFLSDPCDTLFSSPLSFVVPLDEHIPNNTVVLSPEGKEIGRILEPTNFQVINGSPCLMVFVNARHEDYDKLAFPRPTISSINIIDSDELKSHFTTW